MTQRFAIRPDPDGFSVYDLWTGATAVIAMTPQRGISRQDAEHTAELLNRRAAGAEQTVIQ